MLSAEPKAYGSNWYAATRVESPPRPRLTVELDVDVCVIGAGLAGLTAAREVSRLGRSVVVLEAQSVGWNASGRNTGVVLPGFGVSPDSLIDRVGVTQAKALWARSEAGAEYVRKAARDMPGTALSENGWLHVSKTDNTRAMAHEGALLAGELGAAVEPWPSAGVREALHSRHYFHALHYPRGFCLHPLNYALGLAAAAEAAGARIFEDTPVVEIDPAGVRKRVVTRNSRVRASHVVLAGNVHLTELAPQFASTLLPIFSTTIVTNPIGDELQEAISYSGAVSDSPGHHYRVVRGGRLMWSGQSSVWLGNSQRKANALISEIKRIYPMLRDIKPEYAWTGVTGHTVHGMPQIGEVSPGLWLLGGFGSHGLNTTAMGGEIVAHAIVEGDRTWQMFTPFALVWAGGGFGRIAQCFSGWARRSRESVEGFLARRRESKSLQAQAVRHAAAPASAPVAPETPAEPPEPVVGSAAEPAAAKLAVGAVGPALTRIAEESTPLIPEREPETAPAPICNEQVTAPTAVKPKRRSRKKKAGVPHTLKELSQQMIEGTPTNSMAPGEPQDDDGTASPQPPSREKKI